MKFLGQSRVMTLLQMGINAYLKSGEFISIFKDIER